MSEYTKEQVASAEAAYSKAAYALLAMGHNNFDLIKLMRVESNKVRVARRQALEAQRKERAAARAAKPEKKAASPKKASAKSETTPSAAAQA